MRELENLVRRIAALYPQEQIGVEVVREELATDPVPGPASSMALDLKGPIDIDHVFESWLNQHFASYENGIPPSGLHHRVIERIERPLLSAALAVTNGNQIKAAELLGLNRNTVRKKIRDLDIQLPRGGRAS